MWICHISVYWMMRPVIASVQEKITCHSSGNLCSSSPSRLHPFILQFIHEVRLNAHVKSLHALFSAVSTLQWRSKLHSQGGRLLHAFTEWCFCLLRLLCRTMLRVSDNPNYAHRCVIQPTPTPSCWNKLSQTTSSTTDVLDVSPGAQLH